MDNQGAGVMRDLNGDPKTAGFATPVFGVILLVVILAGVGTGFLLTKMKKTNPQASQVSNTPAKGQSSGIADKKTFKDQAEGILREGGMEGEGSFHLERPGGVSQNVYLTSSTVDLSLHLGKKVRVWGQTFSAEKAGWLMDVGLVENLN